jgi:hypothetical protein
MLTLGGGTWKTCQRCAGQIETHARFCLHCGDKVGMFFSTDCPSCGYSDPLNGPFCIRCGAATSVSKIKAPTQAGFSWGKKTKEGTIYDQVITSVDKGISQSTRGPTWLHGFATVLGLGLGALLALGLINNTDYQSMATRLKWPSGGLVVYSQEPNATISLKSIEKDPEAEIRYFDGALTASGSLALPAVSPGDYLLTLEKSGKKTFIQLVTVKQGHPTIVGYPEKIKLPNEMDM